MMPIEFTETSQDVFKIHVAFKTQPRHELIICLCKVKCHVSANFAKSKYVMLTLHFLSVSYQSSYKTACEWVRSEFE